MRRQSVNNLLGGCLHDMLRFQKFVQLPTHPSRSWAVQFCRTNTEPVKFFL